MNKYSVAVIGLDIEKRVLLEALAEIDFLEMTFFSGQLLDSKESSEEVLAYIKNKARAVLIKEHSGKYTPDKFYHRLKEAAGEVPVVPLGAEAVQAGISDLDSESIREMNRYFSFGGKNNLVNALRYLGSQILKNGISAEKPVELPMTGIFHPEAPEVFACWESYAEWLVRRQGGKNRDGKTNSNSSGWEAGRTVGLLTHRGNWVTDNLGVEAALIKQLEEQGLCVVPVFNENGEFQELADTYFSQQGRLMIEGLINLQIFTFKGDNTGQDIFQKAVENLEILNIPIFRPLISYLHSMESWKEAQDLGMEIPWAFTTPEAQGMIEPLLIGCRDKEGKAVPVPDRVLRLAQRVKKWLELRNTAAKNKKLAIFLHNAPCSGVEATIGMGAGLDVFASTSAILKELQQSGWGVENLPKDGAELHRLIMDKKAYADFRWTSVEDIIAGGGCLYRMSLEEYRQYYDRLAASVREAMEDTWGLPPGEGMVSGNDLVITGIELGNVTLLVQPKRGCYGAKCTGEVCKILQDPACPPPHQYLATYKYAEEVLKVQAVLHVGTHGSLEFLPGKTNALSSACYPDIVLSTLPNLYIYNAGVGTEGVLAKRRTNAVILDHLPPVYGNRDTEYVHLLEGINQYVEARSQQSDQVSFLEAQIREQAAKIPGALNILDGHREQKKTFPEQLLQLKNRLTQAICNPKSEKLHVFGQEATIEDAFRYIEEVLRSDLVYRQGLRRQYPDDYTLHRFLKRFIEQVIQGIDGEISAFPDRGREICGEYEDKQEELQKMLPAMTDAVREVYGKLTGEQLEIKNLLRALQGEYIPPGPSGMPDDNGRNIIPTGRNFYLLDIEKVPSKAAWEIGCQLAEQLIALYLEEEGSFPEKIAMNMISLDISRSKGEQLSQILYLMGIRPVWDQNAKVVDLEVISPEELRRPRIDVTIRISGVLRDCYPRVMDLIDRAVQMVASLDESDDSNFVKKHSRQIAEALVMTGEGSDLMRRSTLRIFGDRPGTYGAGVDLALKASAWKEDTDLAKVFVYFSSYAYGQELHGRQAREEFLENVKKVQVAYDTSTSKRYDILASGFGASVQGGFNLISRIFRGQDIKQYHGSRENPEQVRVGLSRDALRETLNETLLNPLWKEDMQQKGYRGAAELMQRLQNIFDWQCLSAGFTDNDLDSLVQAYVNDPETRAWFQENNLFALEEIARRFLELHQRDKWQADPEVLSALKENYLDLEGEMEDRLGDIKGEIQAGNIEVQNDADIREWQDKLKEVNELFNKVKVRNPSKSGLKKK
ncbi:cobaltochelatase subunit CobN [Dehalobacter sp. DCM]|uniref:cobaltochelatase subunit CobN n=1 Tax=Dehalobacter sp. DCM TaxID=2907827 RepID=UPI00308166A2|nr:cobaltochelatase subunit CobN [Dehalobacter sp. DCM]